jgi:type II secretory ATPase GspE/PulE/Tfp pilus assembly ATPase PilB-like protein
MDIGIPPDIISGNVIGVLAQRLVRLLCSSCKQGYFPSQEEIHLLRLPSDSKVKIYKSVGCKHCQSKGYKGRMALLEILQMDGDLNELVARRATAGELKTAALQKNFRPLAEDGIQRVLEGMTSLAEVSRTVDLTGRLT